MAVPCHGGRRAPLAVSLSAAVPLRACDRVHINHACSVEQALDRCVLGDGHWFPQAGLCRAKSIWSQTQSNPSPM